MTMSNIESPHIISTGIFELSAIFHVCVASLSTGGYAVVDTPEAPLGDSVASDLGFELNKFVIGLDGKPLRAAMLKNVIFGIALRMGDPGEYCRTDAALASTLLTRMVERGIEATVRASGHVNGGAEEARARELAERRAEAESRRAAFQTLHGK